MWTGRQTLQSLEKGLSSVKNDLARIDRELSQITGTITDNSQAQTKILQQIATIRLDEIESGRLVEALNSADRETLEILQKREAAVTRLEKEINLAEKKLTEQEDNRGDYTRKVEDAGKAVIEVERKVQSDLEDDEAYQIQLKQTRLADSIGDEAEEKLAQAQQDRAEKGKPFEGDSLFMYLWGRKYGTTEYSANPLSRSLDSWVARLCKYEKARVNYWTLLEIPKRLQQHADNVRKVADDEVNKLIDLEIQASHNASLPALQKTLDKAEEGLEQYDTAMAVTEDNLTELLEKRSIFASGQDEYTRSCVKLLTDVMARSDVFELNMAVKSTPSREDDSLLRELQDVREDQDDLEQELRESRKRQDKQIKRLKELEGVRRKFKQHRFDDMRSGFSNKAMITTVLNQFLSGVLNGSDLWSTMRRYQRHRDVGAWPDFGSGGLGGATRRKRGSIWHQPGKRGGGIFRMPKSGGFSSRSRGGGFRTGGGF